MRETLRAFIPGVIVGIVLLFGPQGLVAQCPNCCNSIQDCNETGVDCGGPDCMPCASLVPNGSFECVSTCFTFGLGQFQSAPK